MDSPLKYFSGGLAARTESDRSTLPGVTNGPADAYRHILWLAEATRRFGPETARRLGRRHEKLDPALDPPTAMDLHNNEVGIAIGQRARTWDEVVRMARGAIENAPRDGSGGAGVPVWRPFEEWRDPEDRRARWPDIDWARGQAPGRRSPYGSNLGDDDGRRVAAASAPAALPTREPEITFLYSDPANGGRPSLTFGRRLRDPALDRWLAERHARDSVESGGTVHVSAHTRRQDGRPVAVEAHTRSAPTRG